ncbi:odorant receptor 4-like [Phlebotomus argentipes]|uniref:odorant receptor 4-like n=1 Tax=Phlebotomus argentipes TaxID=94469 RepID=UPI002892F206|nr:odorant receptor 4-like [Phlebotomus argentipes]
MCGARSTVIQDIMDVRGISFRKTIAFIDIIFTTIGTKLRYPSCQEFRAQTWLGLLRQNFVFLLIYFWGIFLTADTVMFVVVMTIRKSVSIWEILSQCLVGTYFISSMMKIFIMLYYRDELASMIALLQSLWPRKVHTSAEKDIVEDYMTYNTKWISRYAYLSVSCFFCVNTTPLLIWFFGVLSGEMAKRSLPYVTWSTASEKHTDVTYPLAYFYLFYGSHVGSVGTICFDSLFCVLLSHICLHYKLLGVEMENTVDATESTEDANEEASEERLKKCIAKHQMLMELRSQMDKIFTDVIFVNFAMSTVNICIVGFLFGIQTGLGKLRFVMMLMVLLAQIFLLCWYGQELVDNSQAISDAAYECKWYASSRKFRKLLLNVLHHTQIPQKLVAMHFWDITLQSFTNLVSASWSYFALLNTIYGDLSGMKPEGGLLT